jgi:hypothetical protein
VDGAFPETNRAIEQLYFTIFLFGGTTSGNSNGQCLLFYTFLIEGLSKSGWREPPVR